MPYLVHGTARPKPWTSRCRIPGCGWTATAMTDQALDQLWDAHYMTEHYQDPHKRQEGEN